jgi:hypothetical protein
MNRTGGPTAPPPSPPAGPESAASPPLPNGRPLRVNDFAFKIGTVNGTGSASANGLLLQTVFRMGVPVCGKNVFPSNIQGLPTWYEIRVSGAGTRRARRRST